MKLRIFDTGYYTRTDLTSQESNANRAGFNGTATVNYIELDVTEVTRQSKADTDSAPNVGTYSLTDINYTGFENPIYTFSCVIDKINLESSTYAYSKHYQISRLDKTKGLKLIYPSGVTDVRKNLVEIFGAKNAVTGVFQGSGKPLPASTPYLSGRVLRVSPFKDVANSSKFTFTIEFQAIEE